MRLTFVVSFKFHKFLLKISSNVVVFTMRFKVEYWTALLGGQARSLASLLHLASADQHSGFDSWTRRCHRPDASCDQMMKGHLVSYACAV